ncbi:unnamed protein product [Linum tenue]|uniref:Uncharacterized protein n=1 Tax=Linum tenue TaxID=586396 RepID=A0AAV0LRM1_9ROSI|nr:unnamed protein product [Linum tenue]
MIKRASSRSKGIKVKHVLQISLLLGVCFWLIYQVKHSHDNKKEFGEKDAEVSTTTRTRVNDNEILKLGRKDLHPRVDDVAKNENVAEDDETVAEEENVNAGGDNKHAKELEQELELTKHEEEERDDVSKPEEEERGNDDDDENNKHDVEEEKKTEEETKVESRGAGDNEFGEHDQDKLEGEKGGEALSEEEREKGSEDGDTKESEVNKEEDKEVHGTLPEDEDHEDGSQNSHEAQEEHYKGDDASSAVTHDENNSGKDKINGLQVGEFADNNGNGNSNEITQTNSTLQQEQGDMAANNSVQEDEAANSNGSGIANESIQTDSKSQQEQGEMAANNSASVLSGGEQTIEDEKIISQPGSENTSTTNVTSTASVSDTTSEENATTGGSAIGESSDQDTTEAEKVNSEGTVSGNAQSTDSSSNSESGVDQTVAKDETTGEGVKPVLPTAETDVTHNENSEENKAESGHSDDSGVEAVVGHDANVTSGSSVGQEENSGLETNAEGVSSETVATE